MLENRKKVIYTGLAILLSMTSNICTFPIYATEVSPQESELKIELNGTENQQVQKIIVEKLNSNNYLNGASSQVKVIQENEDANYFIYNDTLVKVDSIKSSTGKEEIKIQSKNLKNSPMNIVEQNYSNLEMEKEVTVEVEKEDNIAPKIELKKKEITLTTNDSFDANTYIAKLEDNIDAYPSLNIQSDVKMEEPGIYRVIYTCTDLSGNSTQEVLTVNVKQGVNYGSIAKAAKNQIGVAQDCTMLVTNAIKAVGIKFHGAPYEYASLGNWTKNPVPGDICIYEGHVALYVGNGKAIHGGFNGTTVESTVACSNAFLGYIHIADNK